MVFIAPATAAAAAQQIDHSSLTVRQQNAIGRFDQIGFAVTREMGATCFEIRKY